MRELIQQLKVSSEDIKINSANQLAQLPEITEEARNELWDRVRRDDWATVKIIAAKALILHNAYQSQSGQDELKRIISDIYAKYSGNPSIKIRIDDLIITCYGQIKNDLNSHIEKVRLQGAQKLCFLPSLPPGEEEEFYSRRFLQMNSDTSQLVRMTIAGAILIFCSVGQASESRAKEAFNTIFKVSKYDDKDVRDICSAFLQSLKCWINFDFQKKLSGSMLIEAAKNGETDKVKFFVEKFHADINGSRDPEHGATALHWAADQNHIEIVKYLLEMGADIEARHYNQATKARDSTPLHWASYRGHDAIVSLLIQKGACIGVRNAKLDVPGKTPLDLAATPSVKKLLESAIEDIKRSQVRPKFNARVPLQEIEIGIKIGGGGFGDVYKATYQYRDVAYKKPHQNIPLDLQQKIKTEMLVMFDAASKYTVTTYGFNFDPHNSFIIMEFMPGGSLDRFLHSNQQISWKIRYQIAKDISYGIQYLHTKNIIHADLKSLNVLLDQNNHAKISDFGLSWKIFSNNQTAQGAPGFSPLWAAPEILNGGSPSKPGDIYSYGVILWELGARTYPLQSIQRNQMPQQIYNGRPDPITQDTPPSMAQLIGNCWNNRPELRPSMEVAVKILEQEYTEKFHMK